METQTGGSEYLSIAIYIMKRISVSLFAVNINRRNIGSMMKCLCLMDFLSRMLCHPSVDDDLSCQSYTMELISKICIIKIAEKAERVATFRK